MLFLDGSVQSIATPSGTHNRETNLILGARQFSPKGHFPGYIDEFRVYDRGFSEADFSALYDLERPRNTTYALVDGKVAPLFDFERFSKIISGKYWRKTSAAQREQLQAGVRTRLVRTIATGLNNYSDQHIRFLPSREGAKPGRTTVRMEIRQSNGGVINLGYRLYQESGQWRIYDVILDGISMAKTYRTQMASHVGRKGMDSFIAVLGK